MLLYILKCFNVIINKSHLLGEVIWRRIIEDNKSCLRHSNSHVKNVSQSAIISIEHILSWNEEWVNVSFKNSFQQSKRFPRTLKKSLRSVSQEKESRNGFIATIHQWQWKMPNYQRLTNAWAGLYSRQKTTPTSWSQRTKYVTSQRYSTSQ